MIKIYKYKFKFYPLLTVSIAKDILNQIERNSKTVITTIDLGLTKLKFRLINNELVNYNLCLRLELIKEIANSNKEHDVFLIKNNNAFSIKYFKNNKFYKLRAVNETAPTLEINGIHMHRIKDITPIQDSYLKVKILNVKKGDKVLDICTGLGYTAIFSFKNKPKNVVSIEKDINVIKIAELNPWSKDLEKINLILGDATEIIYELTENYFNKVIHDPPTISVAENLYSQDFYFRLFEIIKTGGFIFHYVGPTQFISSKKIIGNIVSKCKRAGFKIKGYSNYGILLKK